MAGTTRTVREGLIVGLIGYAAVAVFFTFFDLLAGRGPVFTLNVLGKVVFRGARDPAILQLPIPADVTAMVMYNFFHLFVALAVGLFAAWLVEGVESRPERGLLALLLILAGYVVTVVAVARLSSGIEPLLPFWTIVAVNTLAAIGGGAYLWRAHPGLWKRVRGAAAG
jgi:hypothetical protein